MNDLIGSPIETLLQEELEKCHAPVSGYFVACAIVTEKDTYVGHNYEFENPTVFEHAETRTLRKVLDKEKNPQITKIIMSGAGKVQKFKSYIPCYSCTHALHPYITTNTSIYLLPLEGTTETLSVNFNELFSSYGDLPYSKIKNAGTESLRAELIEKTILKGKELDFIVDLALLGKKESIEFYLTGSATGRGAVSTLIINKTNGSYRDLDLITVVKKDYVDTEKNIEKLLIKHYAKFIKEKRPIPTHQNREGVVLEKTFYYCGENKQLIDFTFSTDFQGSFCYHSYELKNWFHQLS